MDTAIKKRTLGQFFTKNHFWLKDHVLDFVKSVNAKIILDPFAGDGDLLMVAKELGFKKIKGFDIDEKSSWEKNDSLLSIPKIENSLIITNPPYLTNYSARRKGVYESVKKYFDICELTYIGK